MSLRRSKQSKSRAGWQYDAHLASREQNLRRCFFWLLLSCQNYQFLALFGAPRLVEYEAIRVPRAPA